MSILTEIDKTTRSLDQQERELLDLEQAAKSKAEAIRLEKEKQARQEQTLADTRARLLRQMQDLSPTALVEILVREGITCLGDGLVTAADILTEAADIFERSFWTIGTQIRIENDRTYDSEADLLACVPNDLKHFVAKMPHGGFGAVTGLCSIGAIGLVRSMKAEAEDLQVGFSDLFTIDWPTRLAAEAVAAAMRETVYAINDSDLDSWLGESAPDAIVKANDGLLDKQQVIDAFRAAAKSPVLTADSLWSVWIPGVLNASRSTALTEDQARSLADALNREDRGHSAQADFLSRYHQMTGWEAIRVASAAEYAERRNDEADF